MTIIEITGGHVVVDECDADRVLQYRWCIGDKGYALRKNSRRQTERLHRWLMGVPVGDPRQVDHINGDVSDCRRENLRILTPAQNAQNRKANVTGESPFRGVSRRKKNYPNKPWYAHCRIDGKQRVLGYFATEEEAAACAREARTRHMPFAVERGASELR